VVSLATVLEQFGKDNVTLFTLREIRDFRSDYSNSVLERVLPKIALKRLRAAHNFNEYSHVLMHVTDYRAQYRYKLDEYQSNYRHLMITGGVQHLQNDLESHPRVFPMKNINNFVKQMRKVSEGHFKYHALPYTYEEGVKCLPDKSFHKYLIGENQSKNFGGSLSVGSGVVFMYVAKYFRRYQNETIILYPRFHKTLKYAMNYYGLT